MRVGIDLGTTFSAVAYVNSSTGKAETIKNKYGNTITPSVLAFLEDGTILHGDDAKDMQAQGWIDSVAFFKRNMGKEDFEVELQNKTYSAQKLSGILLKKLIEEAENEIGKKIDKAVITVPAYFRHKEREATIEAGKMAGIEVLSIINEPTAATFAYGIHGKNTSMNVLIYDLGGGTFDATIAKIDENEIKILGTDGNHELGGKDWDDAIARWLAGKFYDEFGIDLSEYEEEVAKMMVVSENAKKRLSASSSAEVSISYNGNKGKYVLTEQIFRELSSFMLGITKDLIESLLANIEMTWKSIDGVILVGGSTRMKMIKEYVIEMSGKPPLSGVNVDEAVALGAAIRANIDNKGNVSSELLLLSKKPIYDKLVAKQDIVETEFKLIGAKSITDVIAHSLGMISISADGEKYVNSILIKKNSSIPTSNTDTFKLYTKKDDNELEVYLLQGDWVNPLDCEIVGKYIFYDIPYVQGSKSIIDVTYRYNENGLIEVEAMQKETGVKLPLRIAKIPDDMSWVSMSPKDDVNNKEAVEGTIYIAVDMSGSMSGEPLQMAKDSIGSFIREIGLGNIKVGIIGFSDNIRMVLKPTNNVEKFERELRQLELSDHFGYCNSAQPLDLIYNSLEKKDDSIRYGIILTDGMWSCQGDAIKSAERCHRNGIEIIALGFGSADEKFLKKISSNEDLAVLSNINELSKNFSKIAQVIGG